MGPRREEEGKRANLRPSLEFPHVLEAAEKSPDFQLILSVNGFSTGTARLGPVELAQSNRLRTASAPMPPFDGLPGGNDAWRAEQRQRLTDLVSPERKFGPGAQEDPSSRHRNHFSPPRLLPVCVFLLVCFFLF